MGLPSIWLCVLCNCNACDLRSSRGLRVPQAPADALSYAGDFLPIITILADLLDMPPGYPPGRSNDGSS